MFQKAKTTNKLWGMVFFGNMVWSFSWEDWQLLDNKQRTLYRDMMLETYKNLVSWPASHILGIPGLGLTPASIFSDHSCSVWGSWWGVGDKNKRIWFHLDIHVIKLEVILSWSKEQYIWSWKTANGEWQKCAAMRSFSSAYSPGPIL